MERDPEVGELYVTTTGRTVEIVAVDEVADSWENTVAAIAYRFVGGTMIHLRGQHAVSRWTKVDTG